MKRRRINKAFNCYIEPRRSEADVYTSERRMLIRQIMIKRLGR